MNMELKIDPEFQRLVPPLSQEEYRELETNIVNDGCTDPLTVWDGFIVDGHNRYAICNEHGIDFKTAERHFASKDDAGIWIIRNQFGRRNLSLFQRRELALLLEPMISKQAKENQGKRTDLSENSVKSYVPVDTKQEVAKIAGVSTDTITRTKKILEKAPEETKQAIRNNEVSINQAYSAIIKKERNEKEREMKDKLIVPEFPKSKYSVIVVDPPWEVQKIIREVRPNQKEFDYPTMAIDEIKAIPIEELADDICTLFLWVVDKYLYQAKEILEHWGFSYHLTMAWDKGNGMAMYGFNRQTEFVLVGFKGTHEAYPSRKTIRTSFIGKSPFHSAKPDEFYDMLDALGGNKIDVFARKHRERWDTYGSELQNGQ
jgi:N6-adenosine-specific RNA methylase IME4/Trp operon repressor